MRRRILIGLGLLLMVGLGFVVWLWMTHEPPIINEYTFKAIQEGMTEQDIEGLVGCKGRKSKSIIVRQHTLAEIWKSFDCDDVLTWEVWESDKTQLSVICGSNGKAVGKVFRRLEETESLLDKLRRWLRLPWIPNQRGPLFVLT